MMTGAGWGIGLGGGLWMIVELVVAIAVVVALVWLIADAFPGRRPSTTDDAERILRERLARGEISEAEFAQARNLLGIG